VQVAFRQKLLLQARFHPLAKQGAIGQHHASAAVRLEQADEQDQKQIGGFAGAELSREVVLNPVFFHPTERRIGEDHVP
jgi:hypothetical protein